MDNDTIRKAVRSLFDDIGEVAVTATLRRKSMGSYSPGEAATDTLTETEIRLVRTEKPLSERHDEADTLLAPARRYALLESEETEPKADDDLIIGTDSFTLLQVVPADAGAGILYEVSYQ
jgi:hypothetical protein